MLKHKEMVTEIEQTIGKIQEIVPVGKGFSNEKKWRVMTEKGIFRQSRTSLQDSYKRKLKNTI